MKGKLLFYTIILVMLALSFSSVASAEQPIDGSLSEKTYTGKYDVKFYHVNLKISKYNTEVEGSVLIKAQLIAETDTLAFDLDSQLHIDSVLLNNKVVEVFRESDQIYIMPAEKLANGSYFNVLFYYRGDGYSESTEGGVYNRLSVFETPVTYTLSEPFSTKSWIPCKEDLNDKADSVYVFITAPDSMLVGSNGVLDTIIVLENNYRRFEWKSRYPIAHYLISFSAGYYRDYTFTADFEDSDLSMPIVNFIYNDKEYFEENKSAIDMTTDLLNCFNQTLGIYPFYQEKYGHCTAPMGGGMENQSMTTLAGFNFNLVAHELAHQWFGNYVTCSSWQDIWINEGFASYAEYIANEKVKSKEDAQKWLEDAQSWARKATSGSVYVPEDQIDDQNRIFSYSLTYQKGACLIHMIRHELNNDSIFFQVLKEFQENYAFSSASGEDFRAVLEEITGKSFFDFFQEWYYGEGYPEMEVFWKKSRDTLYIVNNQKPTTPSATPLFHTLIDYKISFLDRDTLVRRRQEQLTDTFKLIMPERVINVRTDPDNWVLKNMLKEEEIINEDSLNKAFLVYPNPTKDRLIVESKDPFLSFQLMIFSSDGKLFFSSEQASHYMEVSTTDLAIGVYVVKIITDDERTSTSKFIKQ